MRQDENQKATNVHRDEAQEKSLFDMGTMPAQVSLATMTGRRKCTPMVPRSLSPITQYFGKQQQKSSAAGVDTTASWRTWAGIRITASNEASVSQNTLRQHVPRMKSSSTPQATAHGPQDSTNDRLDASSHHRSCTSSGTARPTATAKRHMTKTRQQLRGRWRAASMMWSSSRVERGRLPRRMAAPSASTSSPSAEEYPP